MNPTEAIAFVIIGLGTLVVAFVLYNLISENFPTRPKYKSVTSHLRGRSTIEHALFGPMTLEFGELLGDEHARLTGRDADGKSHTWVGYADEFEPSNIWQCMGITGGNPQFRFIPSKSRFLRGHTFLSERDKYRALTKEYKQAAASSDSQKKITEASTHLQVEKTIDQLGALQRSNQQGVVRR